MSSSNGYIVVTVDGGTNWALDAGYKGAISSTLVNIGMFNPLVGVAGVTRGGKVFVKQPGKTYLCTHYTLIYLDYFFSIQSLSLPSPLEPSNAPTFAPSLCYLLIRIHILITH
jgi:hypothetical protein